MTLTSVKTLPLGTTIQFESKDANDPTVWRGVLEGLISYRTTRGYGDPRSRNEAVRQVDASVPSDVTLLTYFLITVDNNADLPTTLLFADEWIVSGSLVELNLGNRVTLLVDDAKNNPQAILSLLASAGYASRILPNT